MLRRFFSLFRVVAGSAGRAAFQRAAPLYFAILVAATIIFSPMGMRAADVTGLAQRVPLFRLVLWGLWLLATIPAARAVLCEPALLVLRPLPVPRNHFYLSQGALLFAVESPWIALFARGSGVLSGLSVAVAAMAAHALIVAQPRRIFEWFSAILIAAIVALQPPRPLFLALALCALPFAMRAAWRQAADRGIAPGRPLVRGPALVALGLAYSLTLWRSHAALLGRGFLMALLGAAIATLSVRNNHITAIELRCTVTLGVLSAPLLLGACGFAGPILRSEKQAQWLLACHGVRGATRVLSAALPVGLFTALLGGASALLVGILIDASPLALLRLSAGAALLGVALGIIASCSVRWAQRGDKKDSDRVLLALVGLLFIAALLSWALHEFVIAVFFMLAIYLIERAISALSPRSRFHRLQQERRLGEGEPS